MADTIVEGTEPSAAIPKSAFVTQEQAAELCGKHKDTIRRYRREGQLPNSRDLDGRIEIAVADLVAAGLLDPLAAGNVEELTTRSRSERELRSARHELALERARVEHLTERLARADEEITFLRSLVQPGRKSA